MPRGQPDEATYEPTVQPEDLPRKIIPRANEVSAFPSFGGAIDAVSRKYQADSATWAADQLTQFREKALLSLQSAKDAQPADQDPSNFTSNYFKSFDAQAAPLVSKAQGSNSFAGAIVSRGVQQFRDTLQDHVLQYQAQASVDYRADAFDNHVKTAAAQVEAMPALASQTGATLTDEANAIGGDPKARLLRMRQMDAQISQAAANGLTRQDPRGALQALNDPQNASPKFASVITNLNDAQREAVRNKANEHLGDQVYESLASGHLRDAQVNLLKNADLMDPKTYERLQNAINTQQEHSITIADKAKRDASDGLLKDAILMQQKGTLTDQWIEKYHNVWEPSAYEYSKKLLAGKEAITDAPTYLSLLNRQSQGEDVRNDTMHAAASGLLDKADAAKLIEGSVKENNWIKQGHDFIQTAGQVSMLEPDPAKAQTLANMQSDWINLARAHPEWANDPGKAEAGYRSIVKKYQLVAEDKTRFTLDYPPYFPGTRMQPDVPGMKQSTFDALQNKEITQDEFNRRAALIQQWQNLLQADAQRKAKQAAEAAK
jgi:hypothetical protein